MIGTPELWKAVLPVVEAFEALAVPYHLGGSVASSFTGIARATQDADLVADLSLVHARPLVTVLEERFYINLERVEHAIRTRRSFNAIHLDSVYKVDVFVSPDTPFARVNMERRIELEIPGLGRSLYVSSPEDIVLHKLLWYRDGSGVSDRQWHDLQGVLRLRKQSLDFEYLRSWAARLGLNDLLQRALSEAGLQDS